MPRFGWMLSLIFTDFNVHEEITLKYSQIRLERKLKLDYKKIDTGEKHIVLLFS